MDNNNAQQQSNLDSSGPEPKFSIMEKLLDDTMQLKRQNREYFLKSPNATLDMYKRDIREKVNQITQEIPLNINNSGSGVRQYLIGKILNICLDYQLNCEEQLEHSLRINSLRTDAWLELGKCVWKRSDSEKALACFKKALEIEKSPKALCLLSAALRAKACREIDIEKRIQTLNEALEVCRKVTTEIKDYPFAWYSLANTHLARFFNSQQLYETDLSFAVEAFKNALKSSSSSPPFINPDLHLNYGQALYYRQDYAEAIVQFRRALAIEPYFLEANQQLKSALDFLVQLKGAVDKKGHISQHRLSALIETFPLNKEQPLDLKQLFEQTKNGGNYDKSVIRVRCIGQSNELRIPYTLICLDKAGMPLALTIYNSSNKFTASVGDMLTIFRPKLIQINYDDLQLQTPTGKCIEGKNNTKKGEEEKEANSSNLFILRVTHPKQQLLKNGSPLDAGCCAFTSLSIQTQIDANSTS